MTVKMYRDLTGAILWMDDHKRIHREDGPAFELPDGRCQWYYKDKQISFEDWCKKLKKSNEEIVLLKLRYGQ